MRAKANHLRGLVVLTTVTLAASLLLVLVAPGKQAEAIVASDDVEVNSPLVEHQDSRDHQSLLVTSEKDCQEIVFTRLGNTQSVREVVPSNFIVTEFQPGTVPMQFTEYHCETISVDDKFDNNVDDNKDERPTTVTLGSVPVTLPNGKGGRYLLWLGTDNPILAARYRQLGFPAEYLPHTSFSVTGTQGKVLYEFIGDELDHTLQFTAPVPTTEVPPSPTSTLTLLHEGSEGLVQLKFVNDTLNLGPQRNGPLTTVQIDPTSYIASLLASSPTFSIPVTYVSGGWTGTTEPLE
jgi:hypothetical protein